MVKIRDCHWSLGEMEDMSTKGIIKKLELFGINFAKEEFSKKLSKLKIDKK